MKPTQKDFDAYDNIVNIADSIYRKRVQQKDAKTSKIDIDAIFSVLRGAGFHSFSKALEMIQEEAMSGILEMDILRIAAHYGTKSFRKDFNVYTRNAEIVHAVFSKLASAETKQLEVKKTALGDKIKFTPENCNKALRLSESNLAISRTERIALQKFLFAEGCLAELAQKEEKPEAPAQVKVETKVISISPAITEATNGEEKKQVAAS